MRATHTINNIYKLCLNLFLINHVSNEHTMSVYWRYEVIVYFPSIGHMLYCCSPAIVVTKLLDHLANWVLIICLKLQIVQPHNCYTMSVINIACDYLVRDLAYWTRLSARAIERAPVQLERDYLNQIKCT